MNWEKIFKSSDIKILLYLHEKNESRYSELLKNLGKTRGVLAASLRDLKKRKLVNRTVEQTAPVQTKYTLTDKGLTVANLLAELKKQISLKD